MCLQFPVFAVEEYFFIHTSFHSTGDGYITSFILVICMGNVVIHQRFHTVFSDTCFLKLEGPEYW